jgi:hypothetical protein
LAYSLLFIYLFSINLSRNDRYLIL